MKYLIYLRISTKIQDERTQLDHCLRFIKQRDNTDFKYEVFIDKITSKKEIFKREGCKEMFSALERGDTIVAIRLDRLARKLYEATALIELLDKSGAEIILVDQPGIENKIMLGLYAGMAEEEVKLLRKRVKEKLQSKKNRGERYSRYLPYGFGLHETKLIPIRVGEEVVMKRGILVPVYEEQQTLIQMYKLADEGLSHQKIATNLHEQGYRNREGKPFQKMSIYRILARRDQPMLEGQSLEAKESLQFH